MHSYTLNNWDGNQSQKGPVATTATKSRTSLKHDNSEPKTKFSAVSHQDEERVKDSEYSRPVGTPDWRNSEELGNRTRTMTNNGVDDTTPASEQVNRTTNDLATVISQAYRRPTSRPRSQALPATTVPDGRVQDQAGSAFGSINPPRIIATTDLTPAQLINSSEKRLQSIAYHQPTLTTHHNPILKPPTQSDRARPRSQNSTTTAHQTRQEPEDVQETQKISAKSSTSEKVVNKSGSTFTPRILHKDTGQKNSIQLINRKESVAVLNTVAGTRLLSNSQLGLKQLPEFTSRPSALLGAVPDATKNSLLSQKPPTKSRDKSAAQDVQTTSHPLTHLPRSPTSTHFSRSRLPTSPSIEEQPSQQTIPSPVPSSPILVSEHDEYTSADAEGESADDLDFDILELQQPASQIQTDTYPSARSSVIPGTQSSTPHDTLFHASKPTSHTSVYDLFTPPPTHPPSRVPSKRKLPAPTMRFAYVEIPPLPSWKRKKDYRPLKRRKQANPRSSVYWEGGDQQEEESVSEYEPNEKGRTSVRGRRTQRGRVKEKARYNTRRKEPLVQSKAYPVLPTVRRRSQLAKTTPSTTLSLQYPSEQSQYPSEEPIEIPDSPQGKSSPPPIPSLPRSRSPSVVLISPPPQTKSSPSPTTSPLPHPDTSTSAADPHHTTDHQQLLPSHDESDTQKIQVHTAFHPPPAIIYFNTRFVQNAWGGDPTVWASSGVCATRRCVRPTGFIWDTISPKNSGEQEGEFQLDIGGRVAWDGCSTDEEQEVEELLLKRWNEEQSESKATGALKTIESGRKLNARPRVASMDNSRSVAPPVPMTPIPKVDMMQVLKSQKAASARRTKSSKKREGKASTRDTRPSATAPASTSISAPGALAQAPQSWPPQSLPGPAAGLQQSSQPPRYLSEKARGKQKAVEPEPIDIIAPNFRDAVVLSPTNTGSASYHSVNPHESFDRQMEDYIVFDLVASPEKQPRDAGTVGDSNTAKLPTTIVANSIPTASSSSAAQNSSPYRWQYPNTHTNDLFLPLSPSRDPAPSVFGHFDGLGLDSFYDSFGVLPEGEKAEQMTTINPAFLSSDRSDYGNGTDLELDGVINENRVPGREGYAREDELGPRISDKGLGVRAGYQTARVSPIVVSSRSSTSSYFPSTTSEGLGTISPAVIAGRTPSPEFSDYHASNHVSTHQRLSGDRTSQTGSGRLSLALASGSRARQKVLIIDESEEEEQAQRGFDLAETADGGFMGSPDYEDLSLPRQKWRKLSKKISPVRPVQAVASTITVTSTHRPGRGQEWECSDEESYCHQCRRRTRRLKMTCLCEKKFCNRCIAVRYPSFPFQLQLDDFECPYCRNICNCDQCSRKRGEVYVSLRVSLGLIPKGGSVATPVKKLPKRWVARPPELVRSGVVPLPLPEPINDMSGPFSFWGSVYDLEGRKIANAFSGICEDKVVIAHAVEGYKRPRTTEYVVEDGLPPMRTFIGACQPSWRLGANPIIKELGRRRNRVNNTLGDYGTRWFVGKEYLLHCPVVAHGNPPSPNPFSDLSSLSSLSDGSDREVGTSASAFLKHKIYSGSINADDSIKNVNNFDPNAVETRDTVRVLALALEACGLVVKIDQALINR